jgi:hypothetical protein
MFTRIIIAMWRSPPPSISSLMIPSDDVGMFTTHMHQAGGVHVRTEDGRTLGHILAYHGYEACMQSWMDAGGDVHARDHGGTTIGHAAAGNGSDACLRAWINAGGDVHAETSGRAPQTIGATAAYNGHVACLQTWIESGGSIHQTPGFLDHPLRERTYSGMFSQHPCILVTRASLEVMHGMDPSSVYRPGFMDARGRLLAERMMPVFADPIHLAVWIQALSDR